MKHNFLKHNFLKHNREVSAATATRTRFFRTLWTFQDIYGIKPVASAVSSAPAAGTSLFNRP
ncbi:MAG: hypothetical protein VB858_21065 [Planctomycetaceae bacterium]